MAENKLSDKDAHVVWKMSFDLNTLEHLGVKLYTQYPPMIAELISNSWDADADNVWIYLHDGGDKKIVVRDDGNGMDKNELNSHFLAIGRNRRIHEASDRSPVKARPVLGKKGIGKLSMFGIAERITVDSIKNGLRNCFVMEYEQMKESKNDEYLPIQIAQDEETAFHNGTTITLEKIKRKSNYDAVALANSLSKRFSIFGDLNTEITRNSEDSVLVKNRDLFEGLTSQFEWKIPEDINALGLNESYYRSKSIDGTLMTSATPLKKNDQGVTLLARGKLVQENAYFDDRSNDYFHAYLYGFLNVDFVDQDHEQDNVSTDRKSLVWEGELLEDLKSKLNDLLVAIEREWRKQRKLKKKSEFKKRHNIDIDKWLTTLPAAEVALARKIAVSVLENSKLEDRWAVSFFKQLQDVFSLQGFKDFAAKLDDLGILKDDDAIRLLEDWQLIEAKELAKIAQGRISTINQFEKYIRENASETKVMQKFLEEFPWILDPKMSNFEREVTFSKLLKESFPDEDLAESNRRIDFLCNDNGNTYHIIELKRPNIKISFKEIAQCSSYKGFIKERCGERYASGKNIKAILISENHEFEQGVRDQVEDLRASGNFEIKTYSELLAQARKYHEDFINVYNDLVEKREKAEVLANESTRVES